MKTLIVEDDLTSRRLLQKILSPYGSCDIAVDGKESVEAFHLALEEKQPYDLICIDIMMPKMDGQEVLREIRKIEAERRIHGLSGAKIIMTTALGDKGNIMKAFKEQCEAYLVKPIDRKKLLKEIKNLGLLEQEKEG